MVRIPTSASSASVRARAAVALLALAAVASGVSAVFGQAPENDRGRVLGDRKCVLCHREQKEKFALSIHGGLADGEDSIACETCHGPGERHVGSMGEKEFIIRFGDLSPEAASKRCLGCHQMTARKGGHVDGFLTSRILANGMGCTSCHQAHAPKIAGPSSAPVRPEPAVVGTAACLVCHSDRSGTVRFPHRARTEDAMGCETCHGPGREHALARGRGPIRNPDKMEPAKADAACVLCHSGLRAPGHFQPAPGKEKCADCHVIHPPEAVATAAAPEPGRPPFRLASTEPAPRPAVARRPIIRRGIAPPPADAFTAAGLLLSGEIRAGGRLVAEDGNGRVLDQDLNLDSGIRIFDFSLRGASVANPDTRFTLAASGMDDGVESYSLDAQGGAELRLTAKVVRTNFVYHATGDPWDQSARKDRASFEVTWAPEGEWRFSAGLDLWSREADRVGSRLVEFGLLAAREPLDESGLYAWGRAEWATGPWTLSLTQGWRADDLAGGYVTEAPATPTSRYGFFDQETEVRAPVTTILGRFRPSSAITVDGKLVYSPIDAETDTYARETGPGGGAGFVEQAFGTVDAERDFLRAELGAAWQATDKLTLTGQFEHLLSLETADGSVRTLRSDPPASAPATTLDSDGLDRAQRFWRLRGEGRYRVADWASVRGGLEWGYQEYDRDTSGSDPFYDTNFWGPVLGFDADPVEGVSIEALYRFVRAAQPFVPYGEESTDQGKLKVRWKVAPDLTLTGFLNERFLRNAVHDTSVHSWSAGIGAALLLNPGITVDLGVDYQGFVTETDVLRTYSGTPVAGRSEFEGRTVGLHAAATWAATPELDLTAAISLYTTSGDFPTDLFDFRVGAEYRLREDLSLGTDLRLGTYDEDESTANDYDAFLAEVWVRFRF